MNNSFATEDGSYVSIKKDNMYNIQVPRDIARLEIYVYCGIVNNQELADKVKSISVVTPVRVKGKIVNTSDIKLPESLEFGREYYYGNIAIEICDIEF